MWNWLRFWQSAISRLKPAIEQPVIKEQALPPTTLLAPAPRAAVAKALPHQLAVDLQEARLFYRSLEGKLVSRAIASGTVEWESQELGYPLRVTDQILWAVQGDSVAAYSTAEGQLLMRSNGLELPGDIRHTLCDLSEQTLRIYSESSAPPSPNLGIPVYLPPPLRHQAAYEISLMTGEVTTLYQVTLHPQSMLREPDDMTGPGYDIVPRIPKTLLKSLKSQSITEQHQCFEQYRSEYRKAYHWPDWQELEKQAYRRKTSGTIELQTASIVIHEYSTNHYLYTTALSVFSDQPPSTIEWQVTLEECLRGPPHC
ncbi:hypothetical protein NDI52_28385 [Leptolyngbya sp. PL-A3]|uniref:hypothetical protein n=1 Tax=Leptolyngbya sp. PL-A3 TaxID=2933911 RepID=UPI003298FD92